MSGFSSVGDPHETMGDGTHFNNENVGVYTAMQSASGDFAVQHQLGHVAGFPDSVTLNTGVAIKMSGGAAGTDVVKLDAASGTLTVNDAATKIAPGGSLTLPSGGSISLSADGKTYAVTSPKGDVVDLTVQSGGAGGASHWIDMTGHIGPGRVDGEISGELGTFHSAGSTDTMVKADGSSASSTADLIAAYSVPAKTSMFDLPAASFQTMSAPDAEAKTLTATNQGLQKSLDGLNSQITDLKAQQITQQSAYTYLKGLPANEVTPVDQQFISKFEAGQTQIAALQTQVSTISGQINTNQQRLDALSQIDTLSGQNKNLFQKEETLANDRIGDLEAGKDVSALTTEIGSIEDQIKANTSQIAALDKATGGTGSYADGTDPNSPGATSSGSGTGSTSASGTGSTTASTSASGTGSTTASGTGSTTASTTASGTGSTSGSAIAAGGPTTSSASATGSALTSAEATQVLNELPDLLNLFKDPSTSSEAAQALSALMDAINVLDSTSGVAKAA